MCLLSVHVGVRHQVSVACLPAFGVFCVCHVHVHCFIQPALLDCPQYIGQSLYMCHFIKNFFPFDLVLCVAQAGLCTHNPLAL